MPVERIAILGAGKLAFALNNILEKEKYIVKNFSRQDFAAEKPQSLYTSLTDFSPDLIFNTVVSGGIDACAENPQQAWAVNTLFPLWLARYCSENNSILAHFSTDAVFSEDGDTDAQNKSIFTESSAARPQNIYGATKYAADCLIMANTRKYYIFRLPMVFGPSPKKDQFLERLLILAKKTKNLKISQNIYANPIYSIDAAKKALSITATKDFGLYHLAGKESCSLFELMQEVIRLLQLDIKLDPVMADYFLSKDKRNLNVITSSEKTDALRGYKQALIDYCKNFREYLT